MQPNNQMHVKTESYTSDIRFLSDDLVHIERNDKRKDFSLEWDAFPSIWSLGISEVSTELLGIHRHGEVIRKDGLWAAFIPPYSLIEWELAPIRFQWRAYISTATIPGHLPTEPIAFPWNRLWNPQSVDEIFSIVENTHDYLYVGKEEISSSVATKTRSYIERNFNSPIKLSEIANQLGFCHAVMTRSFKKAYGISPIAYRNKLRVFESLKLMLFKGKNVVGASQEVGFGDTSRFNKQFRDQISTVPSVFIPPKGRKV